MHQSETDTIYDDPLCYDLIHVGGGDVPFYLDLIAQHGGPVLELGCGTGRVSIPIAERGFEVTGIDIADQMLGVAKQRAAAKGVSIDWIHGDIRSFDLRQFKIILYPANSLSHLLELESIEACLGCVRKHLVADGRFALSMFNPCLEVFLRDPNQRCTVGEYDDPHGRGRVIVAENNVYDRARQVNEIKWYYRFEKTGEEIVKNLAMRIYYPQELDALLHYNGLEIEHKYGGFDRRPFVSDSPLQVVVCRKG